MLALICCVLWTARAAARAWRSAAAGLGHATTGVHRWAAAAGRRSAACTCSTRAGSAKAWHWLAEPVAIKRGHMLAICAMTSAAHGAALLAAASFQGPHFCAANLLGAFCAGFAAAKLS